RRSSLIEARSSPSTRNWPEVGRSMPAIRFSSVVLPEPEGPIRQRNSPSSTSRSTFSRAGTARESRRKILDSLRISTTGFDMGQSLPRDHAFADSCESSLPTRLIPYNSRWRGYEFLNDVTLTRRCAPPSPKEAVKKSNHQGTKTQ